MTFRIIHGDCLDVLPSFGAASIDSCVTDPPYHLQSIVKRFAKSGRTESTRTTSGPHQRTANGFMGKQWDGGDISFRVETWAEVLRVLKPGGHLVAFGGTRTFHRIAVAIEDAGFEIRDTLMWVYGTGFPKSHNQAEQWEGWGTALKPAWEPIILARKPLSGTVAANLVEHRTGAINIGACRVPTEEQSSRAGGRRPNTHEGYQRPGATMYQDKTDWSLAPEGRWPANLLHDGSDEVLAAFPTAPGQQGALTGNEPSPAFSGKIFGKMARPSSACEPRGDSGSAARFFYCAKASRTDRNDGLAGFEEKPLLWSAGEQNPGSFQAAGTKKAAQNNHPTVKPTELMRWLVRLVTPPGGTVLDPFVGSGSTGRAVVLEGFSFTGIEADEEYIQIANARIAACVSETETLEALL